MALKGVEGVYLPKEIASDLKKLTKAYLTPDGKEVLNPVPLVSYTDLDRPLTLHEQIGRILNSRALKHVLDNQDAETWEEANDFSVEDTLLDENDDSKYTLMEDEFPNQNTKGDTSLSPPDESSKSSEEGSEGTNTNSKAPDSVAQESE